MQIFHPHLISLFDVTYTALNAPPRKSTSRSGNSRTATRPPLRWTSEVESLIGYLRDRKSASGSYLTRRAPLFIDSAYADLVWNLIDRLTAAASSHTPALAYVRGVMHSRENDRDAAVAWLTKAWSLVQDDEALLARIGLELGLIYLRSADLVAADAIVAQLEWREKRAGGMPPDVLLLQGLLFEARNELKAAEKSIVPLSLGAMMR